MMRYPRLAALRAAREQREAVIREPLEREIAQAARMIRALRETLRSLERVVGSEVGKHVIELIGHKVSGEVRRQITEAVHKGYAKDGRDPITITVSADALRWTDPQSIENHVLREWKERSAPRASLRAFRDGDMVAASQTACTVLDIRIPELGYRHVIADGLI